MRQVHMMRLLIFLSFLGTLSSTSAIISGKSALSKGDRKFLKDVPRKQQEIVDGLLAAFERYAEKDKQMQAAIAVLRKQELRSLRKRLDTNTNYRKFNELMDRYDTIYQYLFRKDPLGRVSDFGEEHEGVAPSMASFFVSEEYLTAERELSELATETVQRLKNNLRVDDNEVIAFDEALSQLMSTKESRNVMKYLGKLGFDCERYAYFVAGDYLIKRTLAEENAL